MTAEASTLHVLDPAPLRARALLGLAVAPWYVAPVEATSLCGADGLLLVDYGLGTPWPDGTCGACLALLEAAKVVDRG